MFWTSKTSYRGYMIFYIADAAGDMAKVLYSDLRENKQFVIFDKNRLFGNRMLNLCCRAVISQRTSWLCPSFLRCWVYNLIFKKFKEEASLCIYLGTAWYDPDLVRFLKKKFPKVYLVLNFHDTVESKLLRFRNMSVPQLKKEFDLIYTYSEEDQKKYEFEYTPDMYSKLKEEDIPYYPKMDVVFIGAAKDRLNLLCEIYDKLSVAGLKCWFYIVGAKKEEIQHREGIVYSDEYMPFLEVIGRQFHSNCILEVTQSGCTDATLRFWDAVMYNKRIITNCSAVAKYEYYNKDSVLLFDSVDDIDPQFVKETEVINYGYKGDISPLCVFRLIEEKLTEQYENKQN